jgi:YggT family protein
MLSALVHFVFVVLGGVLGLLVMALIVSAILSWLVAFDVINYRNRFVYSLGRFLDAVTAPVLRPFQKIIPPLGGVDISPVIAILVIQAVRGILLPAAEASLLGLLGGA